MEVTSERAPASSNVAASWQPEGKGGRSREVPPVPVLAAGIQIPCSWNQVVEDCGEVPKPGEVVWSPHNLQDGVLSIKSATCSSLGTLEVSRTTRLCHYKGIGCSYQQLLFVVPHGNVQLMMCNKKIN